MITQLITKIRAVLQDSDVAGFETYTASGRTFSIAQENTNAITSITVNGTAIASSKYSYSTVTQIVTIDTGYVSTSDIVIINYTYTKYSDIEITDYIQTALVYMSSFTYGIDFEIASGEEEIFPLPNLKEQNLIVTIVGILINPDWSSYRTSSIQVVYPSKLTKEEKIERLVARFKRTAEGIVGVINLGGETYGI